MSAAQPSLGVPRIDEDLQAVPRANARRSAPASLDEAGVPETFVAELLIKHLRQSSEITAGALAQRLALAVPILEPILERLRELALIEVPRRGSFDAQVAYSLTERGKNRAQEAYEKNQYCGPAPVPLKQYSDLIVEQSCRGLPVTSALMHAALHGLVAPEQLIEQIGASLTSGRPIYLYGPSGSGKTFLAEHMVGVLGGFVRVPHALLVDDQVVQVYDPIVHRVVDRGAVSSGSLDRSQQADARWVEIHRPVVVAGGELTLGTLDLEFDPLTRFYSAPPQLRANNGMLIIDDLGRQRTSARDLMNRWIVPLDRNVDYLTLHTGTKFAVPFDVQVVFSSNLAPTDLADPAFIRRLGYKVFVGEMSENDYRDVVRIAARKSGIVIEEAMIDYLIHDLHRRTGTALLPAYPYDLFSKVRDRAMFHQRDLSLSVKDLEWAWSLYFAADQVVREDVGQS